MWKFMSRSFRSTFRQYKNTKSTQNKKLTKTVKQKDFKFLTPQVVSFDRSRFGSAKENKTSGDNDSNWETKHSWHDAVRWTGAIAIGWIVCQSLCLSKTFDKIWSNLEKKTLPHISVDLQFSNLLEEIRKLEPRQMLTVSCFNNISEEAESQQNIPIAFGSINLEEFDMLVHRQQSF